MRINGINILIFPEYHLTDFPPQALLSRQEAYEMLLPYKRFGFDVLISGYIEKARNEKFSSCLVIDDKEVHNVRKKYPYIQNFGERMQSYLPVRYIGFMFLAK